MSEKTKIEVMDGGPLIVSNLRSLEGGGGEEVAVKKKIALCRCGASGNKPFCDGSHKVAGFKSSLSPAESSAPAKEGDTVIRSFEAGPYEVCGDIELCVEDDSGSRGMTLTIFAAAGLLRTSRFVTARTSASVSLANNLKPRRR